MKNLVYPWDDKTFNGDIKELDYIYYRLKDLGYSIKKEKPNEFILKVLNKILPLVLEDKWLFLITNSNSLLEEISTLIPVVYSLTSSWSSMTVDSHHIYSLVTSYSDEVIENKIRKTQKASLLFWNHFLEVSQYASRSSGSFTALLRNRAKRKCSTVFTLLYKEQQLVKVAIEEINKKIINTFGESFFSIFTEKITVIDIPTELNKPWNKVMRI